MEAQPRRDAGAPERRRSPRARLLPSAASRQADGLPARPGLPAANGPPIRAIHAVALRPSCQRCGHRGGRCVAAGDRSMTTWAAVETALHGILDRRWYTNHGPLAKRLEAECSAATGAQHAVAVTNPTIGLIMIADALGLSGEVILSALAPPRCAQALA